MSSCVYGSAKNDLVRIKVTYTHEVVLKDQYFTADFGISQLFIYRFSNGFQQCDGDLIGVIMTYHFKGCVLDWHM